MTLEHALKREIERFQGKAPKRHTVEAPGKMRVVLSVRHPDGGLPFRFEYRTRTVSTLDAEIRARAAARREGLRIHCTLEINA
jgi:hypothetical protein